MNFRTLRLLWRIAFTVLILFMVYRFISIAGARSNFQYLKGGSKHSWVYATVVCDEQDAKSAMVLVHSIKSVFSSYDVVVLTRNLSSESNAIFGALGALVNPDPEPRLTDGDMSLASLQNLVPSSEASMSGCFQAKLSVWTLTQYNKIVYLSPGMLILKNIDHLFERPELTAVPDNDLPDRFNPGLMVIKPSQKTFLSMHKEHGSLKPQLQHEAQDMVFFNHFFGDWPQTSPEHHLEYGYNANSKLGFSATWNEWVHPNLKAVRFSGSFERWDDVIDKMYPPTRRYDHLRWEVLRDLYKFLISKNVIEPTQSITNRFCHTDFMKYSRGENFEARKVSVLVRFTGQVTLLPDIIHHYSVMRFVHKIYVLPISRVASLALKDSRLFVGMVTLLNATSFRVSERFQPIEHLNTDCLIVCDETVRVSSVVMQSAYKYWMQHPHRTVGFFPSAHYRSPATSQLVYVAAPSGSYSMTSLRLLIMHSDYLQSYTCTLSQAVRDYVDKSPECEDVVFNVLSTRVGNTPPLLMVDNEKLVVEEAASENLLTQHANAQSVCLNDLESMVGQITLVNTTEAKVFLEHDVFTKVEFRDPDGSTSNSSALDSEPVQFEHVFDVHGKGDENLRFMSSIPRVVAIPELVVIPSAMQPQRVLCLRGFDGSRDCLLGRQCNNSFAVSTYQKIPTDAVLMLGTTLVVQNRKGFDDRFYSINLLANLFYPYPDYGFMRPARSILFRRGGMEPKLGRWGAQYLRSILGVQGSIPFVSKYGPKPLCFERTVLVRRFRPVPAERAIVLRESQVRVASYCTRMAERLKKVPREGWGFGPPKKGVTRVLFFHADKRRPQVYGMVANDEELAASLAGVCNRNHACEFISLQLSNFTDFCEQVLLLEAVDIFISVSGDNTMENVLHLKQSAKVVELVPFGLSTYDPRLLKVYQEASKWLGLEYHALFESSGPECVHKEAGHCRGIYKTRHMEVDVAAISKWLNDAVHL